MYKVRERVKASPFTGQMPDIQELAGVEEAPAAEEAPGWYSPGDGPCRFFVVILQQNRSCTVAPGQSGTFLFTLRVRADAIPTLGTPGDVATRTCQLDAPIHSENTKGAHSASVTKTSPKESTGLWHPETDQAHFQLHLQLESNSLAGLVQCCRGQPCSYTRVTWSVMYCLHRYLSRCKAPLEQSPSMSLCFRKHSSPTPRWVTRLAILSC